MLATVGGEKSLVPWSSLGMSRVDGFGFGRLFGWVALFGWPESVWVGFGG